jgi:hypothetical protein
MNSSLRKTHRLVWLILAILLPLLVICAYIFIPSIKQ